MACFGKVHGRTHLALDLACRHLAGAWPLTRRATQHPARPTSALKCPIQSLSSLEILRKKKKNEGGGVLANGPSDHFCCSSVQNRRIRTCFLANGPSDHFCCSSAKNRRIRSLFRNPQSTRLHQSFDLNLPHARTCVEIPKFRC
jgi:hypothetical protein